MAHPSTDPIHFLQEISQKYHIPFPEYVQLGSQGKDHKKTFFCRCVFDKYKVTASSTQKTFAKFAAASLMVQLLGKDGSWIMSKITRPINFLQEICQKYHIAFPEYIELGSQVEDHKETFFCQCVFDGYKVTASSTRKKCAKFAAASLMIQLLEKENYFPSKLGVDVSGDNDVDVDQPGHVEENWTQYKQTRPEFATEIAASERDSKQQQFINMIAPANNHQLGVDLDIGFQSSTCLKDNSKEVIQTIGSSFLGKMNQSFVFTLKHICAQRGLSLTPKYYLKERSNNFVVVECKVGSVSGKGRAFSVRDATESAAEITLERLIKEEYADDVKESLVEDLKTRNGVTEFNLETLCGIKPKYNVKRKFRGTIFVTCEVGNVSEEGSSKTEEDAKAFAAERVLEKLIKEGFPKEASTIADDQHHLLDSPIVASKNLSSYYSSMQRPAHDYNGRFGNYNLIREAQQVLGKENGAEKMASKIILDKLSIGKYNNDRKGHYARDLEESEVSGVCTGLVGLSIDRIEPKPRPRKTVKAAGPWVEHSVPLQDYCETNKEGFDLNLELDESLGPLRSVNVKIKRRESTVCDSSTMLL